MKLVDIATSALAVFESVVSKALRKCSIDKEEFNKLHTLYHEALKELSDIDHKMEAENRNQTGKNERYNENHRNKKLMICSLCYFACYFKNG